MKTNDYPESADLRPADVLFPRCKDVHVLLKAPVTGIDLPPDSHGTTPGGATQQSDLSPGEWAALIGSCFSLSEGARLKVRDACSPSPSMHTLQAPVDINTAEMSDALLAAPTPDDMKEDFVHLCRTMAWSQGHALVTEPRELPVDSMPMVPASLRTKLNQAIVLGQYIGHAAVVDIDETGRAWVIESTYTVDGVHMVPYEDWREQRQQIDAVVWHARMQKGGKDLTDGAAHLATAEAHRLRMLGKRYAIFDSTDLNDDRRVYCVELVWRCGMAAGVNLDNRRGLAALFPFLGPKTLSRSPGLQMLNMPDGLPY